MDSVSKLLLATHFPDQGPLRKSLAQRSTIALGHGSWQGTYTACLRPWVPPSLVLSTVQVTVVSAWRLELSLAKY